MSSVLATASPPAATISSTTCWAGPASRPDPSAAAADVVDDDPRALGGEQQRLVPADAAARARSPAPPCRRSCPTVSIPLRRRVHLTRASGRVDTTLAPLAPATRGRSAVADAPTSTSRSATRSTAGIARLTINAPDQGNALTRGDARSARRSVRRDLRGPAGAGRRAARHRRPPLLHRRGARRRAASGARPKPEGAPDRAPGDVARLIRTGWQRLIGSILDCEKPVIAAVNGTAAGGGMQLALACDLVVMADTAKFIEVFVRRGHHARRRRRLPAAPPRRAAPGQGAAVPRRGLPGRRGRPHRAREPGRAGRRARRRPSTRSPPSSSRCRPGPSRSPSSWPTAASSRAASRASTTRPTSRSWSPRPTTWPRAWPPSSNAAPRVQGLVNVRISGT